MKNVIFAFIALFTFLACTENGPTPPLLTFENNILEVHITDGHSRETLMDLKKQLQTEYNLQLNFEDLRNVLLCNR